MQLPVFLLLSCLFFSHLTSESTPSTDHQFLTQLLREHQDPGHLTLSPGCRSSLSHVLSSLIRGQEWAKKMSSSSRHRPPDVRSGQLADFGDFDSCIKISVDRSSSSLTNNNNNSFQGKYCLYRQHFDFSHESTKKLMSSKPSGFSQYFSLESVTGSICLPSTCSDHEIRDIIQEYLTTAEGSSIELRSGCETHDRIHDPEFAEQESPFQWILITWCILIFLATCLSPTIDSELLKCFSVTENTAHILKWDTKSSNSAGREYEFLYGYRFLYLVVASMMHIFELQIFWSPIAVSNIANYHSEHSWLLRMAASHFSHSMGANFVWAGFLSFAGRLSELRRNKRFNLVKGITNRILRTMPTIIGCYLMILSFPRSLVSGPVFRESFEKIRSNALSNFWTELTFTQNHLYPHETALMPTWIISSDIQLFLFSFWLIHVYHRNRVTGILLLLSLTILSMVMQGTYLWYNEYPAFLDFSSYDLAAISRNIGLHISTINYISSYLVGMIVAIMIRERFQIESKSIKSGIALFLVACYLGTFAWPFTWKDRHVTVPDLLPSETSILPESKGRVSRLEELVYGSIYRTLIASAIAGSVYWHVTVNDWIRSVFAARIFVILGRFNYSIYMAHFLFIYLDIFTTRRPIDYDTYSMIIRTSYVVFYGIVLGYMTHLLFEAPFVRLSRWMFTPESGSCHKVPSPASPLSQPIRSKHIECQKEE